RWCSWASAWSSTCWAGGGRSKISHRRTSYEVTPPMKKRAFTLMLIVQATIASAAPRTMRVDYYHTGNAKEERYSLDRIVIEPLPFPGNPARPLDDTNRGKYFFEVVDGGGRVMYSR